MASKKITHQRRRLPNKKEQADEYTSADAVARIISGLEVAPVCGKLVSLWGGLTKDTKAKSSGS